jgi:hypothetical protein
MRRRNEKRIDNTHTYTHRQTKQNSKGITGVEGMGHTVDRGEGKGREATWPVKRE